MIFPLFQLFLNSWEIYYTYYIIFYTHIYVCVYTYVKVIVYIPLNKTIIIEKEISVSSKYINVRKRAFDLDGD